jgi:hypothetical protein
MMPISHEESSASALQRKSMRMYIRTISETRNGITAILS